MAAEEAPKTVEERLAETNKTITDLTESIKSKQDSVDAELKADYTVVEAGEATLTLPPPPAEDDEEAWDKAVAAKDAAVDAIESGDWAKAAEKYLEALAGDRSPMMLANLGRCYVKMKKPADALVALDAALEMNPDSAKSRKVSVEAALLTGDWETALTHVQKALQIDFDENTFETEKKLNGKLHDLKEMKTRLAQAEADLTFVEKLAKQDELKKQREQEQAAEAAARAAEMAGGMGGMPGGGMPGGGGMGGMADMMNDPDIQAAMANPKVMAALQEVMTNPAAMAKYQNDPEVMELLGKLQAKFAGAGMGGGMPGGGMPGGGMAGGMPGGMPGGGMPGGMPGDEDLGDGPEIDDVD